MCSHIPSMGGGASSIEIQASSIGIQTSLSLYWVEGPIKRFSISDITNITLQRSNPIGVGGSGKVYKGQLPVSGLSVAVKILLGDRVSPETFINEVITMCQVSHPNIVKLYGFCYEDKMKAIVCEYMDLGSLDKVLYEKNPSIEWVKLYEVAIQIAKGLSYLHDTADGQFIHYDVKPANVLLDSNLPPKLTDFGLTKFLKKGSSYFTLTKVSGTRGYVAPEAWELYRQVTCKCDVYSFGIMLFDILGRKRSTTLPKEAWEKHEKKELEAFINDCVTGDDNIQKAKILSMVGFWCIQFYPNMRPSMSDVTYVLENEILVTAPPNPFYPSRQTPDPIPSMQLV